jgi:two-component system LytT family response regulator/two-component system response regulator LytT
MSRRSIRAMIVDDEQPARDELRFLLNQYPDVVVVAEAGSFQEAVTLAGQTQPHLVFLDIEMPGLSGIQTAEMIAEIIQPLIVFATAHEEYALKAFELNAVDYLLKPFAPKRVAQCLDKVRQLLAAMAPVQIKGAGDERVDAYQACRQKLAIEQGGKAQIVSVSDIIAAACTAGQVVIYTSQKTYETALTLQDLQSRLGETQFFRSHRSFLVNLEKIREVIPWFNGTYNLVLEGLADIEVPVSRQQAPRLKKLFGL